VESTVCTATIRAKLSFAFIELCKKNATPSH
jgi:hypothetical protein